MQFSFIFFIFFLFIFIHEPSNFWSGCAVDGVFATPCRRSWCAVASSLTWTEWCSAVASAVAVVMHVQPRHYPLSGSLCRYCALGKTEINNQHICLLWGLGCSIYYRYIWLGIHIHRVVIHKSTCWTMLRYYLHVNYSRDH